jgi:hypothetical protein
MFGGAVGGSWNGGGVSGAVQGSVNGAIAAAVFSSIPVPANSSLAGATRIGAGALVSGGISSLMGGNFAQGAEQGAIYAAAAASIGGFTDSVENQQETQSSAQLEVSQSQNDRIQLATLDRYDVGGISIPGGIDVSAPDFIVTPGGTAYPVPQGASGPVEVISPTSGQVTGSAFVGGSGGANGQVHTMRIMDSNSRYPNGYIRYQNNASPKPQGVNPYTGETGSQPKTHFPIDR